MKILLQFVRYIEGWLVRKISFIFFQPVSFYLRKVKDLFFLVFFATFFAIFCCHFWIFNSELVGCFVKAIRNDQRQNIVSIPSILVIPLTVVIRMKGFEKCSQMQRRQFTGENSGCTTKLIEFCNIAFLMRSFKDKII